MTNQTQSSNDQGKAERRFDLEERTAAFGKSVIAFCRKSPISPITSPLITQLVKAGTSVGANYGEANDAESKKDFRHKIGLCRKESKESKHFIRMMVAAVPNLREDGALLWQEAKELNLIFGAILRNARGEK